MIEISQMCISWREIIDALYYPTFKKGKVSQNEVFSGECFNLSLTERSIRYMFGKLKSGHACWYCEWGSLFIVADSFGREHTNGASETVLSFDFDIDIQHYKLQCFQKATKKI